LRAIRSYRGAASLRRVPCAQRRFARDVSVRRALRTRFNSRVPPRGIKSRRAELIVVERAPPERRGPMKKRWSQRVRDPRVWGILAAVGLFVLGSARPVRADDDHDRDRGEKYLYIWAGHVDHSVPDFLAVIDFDEDWPGYGRVINTVPLPGPGATFNEPHH